MILGDNGPLAGLVLDGIERWVAYPILIWTTAFGGYLMGRAFKPPAVPPDTDGRRRLGPMTR